MLKKQFSNASSSMEEAAEIRKRTMSEMVSNVQNGISSGNTVLYQLSSREFWTESRPRTLRSGLVIRDGVNACPTMEEMYSQQSPEVGPVHLPIYRPTGLFNLNSRSEPGLWKSKCEIMSKNLMNANSYRAKKTWQDAPTASLNMRSHQV